MNEHKLCGVYKAVDLIGSKWVLLILHKLCDEKKGFNDLLRAVDGISPRILSLRLKDLLDNGLIKKAVFPTNPPTVEYSITKKGASLRNIIQSLGDWADTV